MRRSRADACYGAACSFSRDYELADVQFNEGGHVTDGTLDNRDNQNKRPDATRQDGAIVSMLRHQHLQQAATSFYGTKVKLNQPALRLCGRWRNHLRIC